MRALELGSHILQAFDITLFAKDDKIIFNINYKAQANKQHYFSILSVVSPSGMF